MQLNIYIANSLWDFPKSLRKFIISTNQLFETNLSKKQVYEGIQDIYAKVVDKINHSGEYHIYTLRYETYQSLYNYIQSGDNTLIHSPIKIIFYYDQDKQEFMLHDNTYNFYEKDNIIYAQSKQKSTI